MDNNSGGESRAALKRKKKLKEKTQAATPAARRARAVDKQEKEEAEAATGTAAAARSKLERRPPNRRRVRRRAGRHQQCNETEAAGGRRRKGPPSTTSAAGARRRARFLRGDRFERRGLLVRGRGSNYLSGWCSSEDVFRALEQPATSGVDVDVTRYDPSSEKRKTLSDGIVDATWARQQLDQGATIRLRQPQDRLTKVQALCRALEGEFGSTVGANAYLTAKDGAQGFAAHWDDVDVFILQLEGRKRWRVGACADDVYRLPRVSSEDFDEEALRRLCPHLSEIILEPGDVLYLPRGFIHSAVTEGLQNSLHLTLSCHRANSWADLLEAALPSALSEAIASDPKMRESLPRDCLHYMGVAHSLDSSDDEIDESDDDDASLTEVAAVRYDPEIPRSRSLQKKRRQRFAERCAGHCKDILARLLTNLDATCDDRSVAFVAERLPPLAPEKGDPATITATTRVHCVERKGRAPRPR